MIKSVCQAWQYHLGKGGLHHLRETAQPLRAFISEFVCTGTTLDGFVIRNLEVIRWCTTK
jgi:hypothetical protein